MLGFFSLKKKRSIGEQAESRAEQYLSQQGLRCLEKNYRCKYGEIDLIMRDSEFLVFIEVRFRKTEKFGNPTETVTLKKQQRIVTTARHYIQSHSFAQEMPCRFDIVGMSSNELLWTKAAFS